MSVTTTIASQFSQCLFYHVRLNAKGEPIPTTMQAYHYNKIADPCTTAWLPPYQMVLPVGKTHCFSKNHQRFYYRVNSQTGKVVPNSLFTHIGQVPRCTGVNQILEYLVHN